MMTNQAIDFNKIFENFQTVAEVKNEYRQLVFKYHPDLGGDTKTMQDLNNAYEEALKGLDGQTTIADGKEHRYQYDEATEREVMIVLSQLISKLVEKEADLKTINVMLIGKWLWFQGDTKPYKDCFKKIGCYWHSKRKCWYYKPEAHQKRRFYYSNSSLDTLAAAYGCKEMGLEEEQNKRKSRKKKSRSLSSR